MSCKIDLEDRKIWKDKFLYEAEECILTRLGLVNPENCPCRDKCLEVLGVIKEHGKRKIALKLTS